MSKLRNTFTNNFTDDLKAWVDGTILSPSDGTKGRVGKGAELKWKSLCHVRLCDPMD